MSMKDFAVKHGLFANGNISGNILISNVQTGVSPLLVNSSTMVANLFAERALFAEGSNLSIEVNNTLANSQAILNLTNGNNITITDNGNGNISIASQIKFETNSNLLSSQSKLNFVNGNNLVITDIGNGNIKFDSLGSNIQFETNNHLNSAQNVLNLTAGNNIVLTDNGNGNISITSIAGFGNSASFSSIQSGTNQTANMIVGSGASLTANANGIIVATSLPYTGLTGNVPFVLLSSSNAQTVNINNAVAITANIISSTSASTLSLIAQNSNVSAGVIKLSAGLFSVNSYIQTSPTVVNSSINLGSLTSSSYYIVDTSTSNVTVTLPTSLLIGTGQPTTLNGINLIFKRVDSNVATGNTALITTLNGSFDGSSNISLLNNEAIHLMGYVVGNNPVTWTIQSTTKAATNSNLGLVRPDGNSIVISANGKLSTNLILQNSGNINSSQTILNLTAGNNIVLTDNGNGNIQITSTVATNAAFANITSGTNQTANMIVGSGASLTANANGIIVATNVSYTGLTGNVPFVLLNSNTNQKIQQGNSTSFAFNLLSGSNANISGNMIVNIASTSNCVSRLNLDSGLTYIGGMLQVQGTTITNSISITPTLTQTGELVSHYTVDAGYQGVAQNIFINLPGAPFNTADGNNGNIEDGFLFVFSRYDSNVTPNNNGVIITPSTGMTIDGLSSITLNNKESVSLISTASPNGQINTWKIISSTQAATNSNLGMVRPDGVTITVSNVGIISANAGISVTEGLMGNINGNNTSFTSNFAPNLSSPHLLIYNGLVMQPTVDFSVTGNVWQYLLIAPVVSDKQFVIYSHN